MENEPLPLAAQLRRDLPPAAVLHVLDVFQKELTALVTAITDAAAAGDPAELRRIAHRVAGTAGAVGAAALEASARTAMRSSPSEPDEMANMAREIATLAEAACAEAAAVAGSLA